MNHEAAAPGIVALPQCSTMATILNDCHASVLAAEGALRVSSSPDAIHRVRTAWRRMRAALRVLARLRPDATFDRLRREARGAQAAFAEVRRLDVFIAESLPKMFPGLDVPTRGRLAAAAATRRQAAVRRAIRRLDSSVLQRLHADLAALTDRSGDIRIDASIALAVIESLHMRVCKRGRHFRALDAHARHRLRLAAKALRDVGALVSPVLTPRKPGRRGQRHLAALLALLGGDHDRAEAAMVIAGLGVDEPGAARLSGQDRKERRALRAAWREFRDEPQPWFKAAG